MFVEPPKPLVKQIGRPPDPNRTRPIELRTCSHHGETMFANYGKGAHNRWRCRRCVGEAVTRRHQKIRRALIAEAGGACAICGYDRCLVSLHFHHVDPAEKSFPMTIAVSKSLAAFRAEAQKCVLLCANCHGEVEAGLVPSPPAGSVYRPNRQLPPPSGRSAQTTSASPPSRTTPSAPSGPLNDGSAADPRTPSQRRPS
jgi:5-methylcytosine-specific restriction endonuclease McrA